MMSSQARIKAAQQAAAARQRGKLGCDSNSQSLLAGPKGDTAALTRRRLS